MFETKYFVRYSRHVHYLGCSLLGGFTVGTKFGDLKVKKFEIVPVNFPQGFNTESTLIILKRRPQV